ncbi:hypothetical protein SAMN05421505_10937 [Sinosporangium album]|uniref:Uncharacterized protein n=1 Tax=Sinosporangium album TaxID=504805 RepID=A0A1G7XYP9_9ACTN|nr:hypothetical protein SAMN05421505_10937 [Sinosporangium album]
MAAGIWVMIGFGIFMIVGLVVTLIAIVLRGIRGPDRQWPVR